MFAKQAECEVLFSYDELEDLVSQPVSGRYETPVALELLLRNTGLVTRQSSEQKYVVIAIKPRTGELKGEIRNPDDSPAANINLVLPSTHYATVTDRGGAFTGHLQRGGVEQIAGAPVDEVVRTLLAGIDGDRTHTFFSYRVAETVLQWGPWDDNPLLGPLDDRERSNVATACDSSEWIELAGGVDKVLARAEQLLADGDARLACHLVEYAALAAPENADVWSVRAQVYRAHSAQHTSSMARNLLHHAALASEQGKRDLAGDY